MNVLNAVSSHYDDEALSPAEAGKFVGLAPACPCQNALLGRREILIAGTSGKQQLASRVTQFGSHASPRQ
jgi:hypothetical protein